MIDNTPPGSRRGVLHRENKGSFIGVTAEDFNKPVILSERSESKDLRTIITLKDIESA